MEKHEIRIALRRHWTAALAAFVLSLLLGVAFDTLPTTVYQATATVSVQPSQASGPAGVNNAIFLIPAYVELVSTPRFYQLTRSNVAPAEAGEHVVLTAKNQTSTGLIVISASGSHALATADWATAAARQLVLQGNTGQHLLSFSLLQPAGVPSSPTFPKPIPITLGAIALGFLLAPITAVVLLRLNPGAEEDETLRRFGVPLLGLLPTSPSLKSSNEPLVAWLERGSDALYGEALRQLRTNIDLIVSRPLDSLAITSVSPGEGKSVVALSVGWSLAKIGVPTCLLDTDLRCPKLHAYLGESVAPGLSDVVEGRPLDVRPTSVGDLSLVAAGQPGGHPADVLARSLPRALTTLTTEVTTIVDTSPLGTSSEAELVLASVRKVLFVIDRRGLRRSNADRAVNALRDAGVDVVGIVVNRAPRRKVVGDERTGRDTGRSTGPGSKKLAQRSNPSQTKIQAALSKTARR